MQLRRLLRGRWWFVAPAALAALLLAGACALLVAAGSRARPSGVEPRAALADYRWDELSAIAQEVAACPDERRAVACAARYGLCGADGSLDPASVKSVELLDGTTVRVALAGVWHDERTDGGKAGLSFVCTDVAGHHAMNHAFEDAEGDLADSRGGWAASDMRAWLNGDFLLSLPPDLRSSVVSVQKRTASMVDALDESDETGSLAGAPTDWVGETSDRLWLLSATELCGTVPENEDLGVEQTMAATYGAEGAQYRLFADLGAVAFVPCAGLVRTDGDAACTWWLRTKTLEFGDGFWLVGADGTPLNGYGEDARVVDDPEYAPDELWGPDHARGVVAGFCL